MRNTLNISWVFLSSVSLQMQLHINRLKASGMENNFNFQIHHVTVQSKTTVWNGLFRCQYPVT
jgi:hypothetical protein